MPLNVPDLDDRRYSDLVEEALAMIPRCAPSWTNHNPSDPGITLIELLAYFTELLIYRLDRVSREHKIKFLRLLRGSEMDESASLEKCSLEQVEEAIRKTVQVLQQPQRAVTFEDYETLAIKATEGSRDRTVIRAHCVERRNLAADGSSRAEDLPGHISVIVVAGSDRTPEEYKPLLQEVRNYLEPKRLLTTRLHVVQPCYVWISLGAVIRLRPEASLGSVRMQAKNDLMHFFSARTGGKANGKGDGWPFGRSLYLSEVYDMLDRVRGVDYVEAVRVLGLSMSGEPARDDDTALGIQIGVRSTVGVDSRLGTKATVAKKDRLIRDDMGKLVGISLEPYELIKIVVREEALQAVEMPLGTSSREFEGAG